ncbi:inositol monophosphatase family protein [Nocardioides caldifontis]|uniref:inositol monophosphatase family protein n=1 Tax=Nocardioides caldifontis TaxID=2588938 RepID=UPI0011DFC9DE|nr:inositol monophosphatase family protein [Nocardioides caldifontis]
MEGELRRVAELVATEAAELVRERRRSAVEVETTKSSPVDVVTEVDRESEAFLRRRLAELRPEDGFFGEEGGRGSSSSGVTWVVDPIDGTVNFLYDIPQYAVSVAAVDDEGRSLAGAVVDVASGTRYSAALGAGATCDGRPLRVRATVPMGQRLALTGFQYQERVRAVQGPAVSRLLTRVRDIRRLGSAALDLCAIGAGRADAYVEEGLNLWDRAAGGLVATEAGARIDVLPGAGGMECVVCAPADGYDEWLDVVRECGFLG